MSEIINDSLVADRFVKQLTEYAEMQSALGERDRAFLVSKSAQVISLLTNHCMRYNIGIPAKEILHIVSQK
jgi:hypothetical protein